MKTFSFFIGATLFLIGACFLPIHRAAAVTSTIIDNNIFATITSHNGTSFTDVFTSSSTGYAFYRDSTGACDFAKTTNGGATWAAPRIIDPQTDCLRVAVWYDRWTPGNTTGTIIHVSTIDSGSDDIWYSRLDTSNDTTSTVIDTTISISPAASYGAGRTIQSITESTDGKIYEGVYNRNINFVLRCTSNCNVTSSNWSQIGTTTTWGTAADDWMLLLPLKSGGILNVRTSISTDTILSKVWNASTSAWDANWTTVDGNCPVNTTYDGGFGAAVNSNNNNIFMDSVCNNATINTNSPNIRTYEYFAASSSWGLGANVESTSTLAITGAKIGLDINTGNLYAVYTGRTTKNSATTANVYYKISTSTTMQSWGARQGPINATSADIYGARIDGMSAFRLYATWADAITGTTVLNGTTVAVFQQNTFTESSYVFFQNQNSAQVGTAFDTQNASSLITNVGGPFRLRILVAVGGTGADVNTQSLKLQYATSSAGTCDTGFGSGESYVDVGTATSSVISFYTNPGVSNGTALTANGQDPIDGTNVVVNESYVSQNTFSNNIAKVFAGQDGKWDFSLINNSGAAGAMYCFRIVNSDGSLLSTYNDIASAQVDTPPTITGLTLNGGNPIALIEGTTTQIQATATVSDANGFADIFGISGVAFRTSSGTSCTANNNDCYIDTGAQCSINSCSGTSCIATCNYTFWYYAQPTDAGTPWASDSWTTLMQASDTVFSGVNATSSPIELLSLLAFETTSTINYGSFSQGQTMSTLTATSVIRASGNVSMNVTLYGTNMTNGAFSIAVGQQHYATSTLAYASGSTLLANPGSTVAIALPKPATSTPMPSSTMFWGIAVPSGQMATVYTGFNSFVGVKNALPWP